MNLSKREYIALELLKELIRTGSTDAISQAYALADDFIAVSENSEAKTATIKTDSKSLKTDNKSNFENLFEYDVEILEFSDKTLEVLKDRKITTIAQLVGEEHQDSLSALRKQKNDQLLEIYRKLNSIGLYYGMSENEIQNYDASEYVQITKDNTGKPTLKVLP